MKTRKYKSGTGWCVWRWSEVPTNYILRLHVIKTPWFAVCVHWLNSPDPEPFDHDHPVTFLSIILRGWYTEKRTRALDFHHVITHRWFNFIRATPADCHTITAVGPNTVTLCFMGPKVREWGYHGEHGWDYWKDYNRRMYGH